MKSSTTWSSSRIATIVSWSFEETIISLVIDKTPAGQARRVVEPDEDTGPVTWGREEHDERDEHVDRGHGLLRSTQFVNRRILTLRMSPKAASVAMMDDPP